jgi:hypothetical protein
MKQPDMSTRQPDKRVRFLPVGTTPGSRREPDRHFPYIGVSGVRFVEERAEVRGLHSVSEPDKRARNGRGALTVSPPFAVSA